MKSPISLPAILSTLAAISLGWLAWQQHADLVQLRATALAGDDRAVLQKRLWDSEKRARDLEARLLAAETPRPVAKTGDENAPEASAPRPSPTPEKATPSKLELMAFLNNPETLRALNVKFREQVETRYAGLFKTLNLPAAQLNQLKELLLERQGAAVDVAAAAVGQGLKPNQDELRQLVGSAQAETDRKLEAALGPAGYAQFQAYENAQLFRGATTNLQQGLTRVSAPLSDEQAEQFTTGIATLAQNSFTPVQQQALRQLTQLQQTRDALQQAERLFKDQQSPPAKPVKKPGK